MASKAICPECGSRKTWKKGTVPTRQGKKERRVCTDCGASFYTGKVSPVKKAGKKGKGRK